MVQGKQQFKGQQKKDVYKRKVQKAAAKTKKGFESLEWATYIMYTSVCASPHCFCLWWMGCALWSEAGKLFKEKKKSNRTIEDEVNKKITSDLNK